MKKLFIIIIFLLFSSSLFAEFILEPVICTTKKTSNCGAYIYNSITGEVYFCDSEECKEVKTPIEIFIEEEIEAEEQAELPLNVVLPVIILIVIVFIIASFGPSRIISIVKK